MSAPPWTPLADRIADELGLYFPQGRLDDLQRGLTGVAREFGMNSEAECAAWLLARPWTDEHVRALAAHLTVGETYFFRDAPLVDAFAQHILPELVCRRRAEGRLALRIWSAGCCSGEEPYSLAILLEQALPDLARWDVAITATDINPRFLDKARAGRYTEWSFRGAPAGLKQRYFERLADGAYRIAPRIRERVAFAELNMVREGYPCATNGTDAVDVIFCRNMLMYFNAQQVRAVVDRLQRSLVQGGWLVVSPTEACNAAFPDLAPVNVHAAVLFCKQPMALRPDAAPTLDPVPEPPSIPVQPPIQPPARPVPEAHTSPRQAACALADQGRLAEALAWCQRWTASDKLDPWAHYVQGVVLIEQGDAQGARQALRRCLYLQPDFMLAHMALGHLARGQGREAQAVKHLAVAGELARAQHDA